MTHSKFYAGIGSRDTPQIINQLMTKIAGGLQRKRFQLRSGGAKGADTAFELGVTQKAAKEIFLPYEDTPAWTEVFTDFFHPNEKALTPFSRKLMNRNAMQILGRFGTRPANFVVCWTKDGKASGGTGHAIRIAEYYKIPVFNLYNEGALDQLKEFVNGCT